MIEKTAEVKMSKRVYFEDITTLALLYHYEATKSHSRMLPHIIIKEYDRIIDKNLDDMNSSIDIVYPLDYAKLIYKNTQDENGNWYDLDVEYERYNIVNNTTRDLIVTSQMPNALEALGIQMIDGKMKKMEKTHHKEENIVRLEEIIDKVIDNPYLFYKKMASVLSLEEKDFVKKQIAWKCCLNCTNPSCRVETSEKNKDTSCVAWENQELIGRRLLLTKES